MWSWGQVAVKKHVKFTCSYPIMFDLSINDSGAVLRGGSKTMDWVNVLNNASLLSRGRSKLVM